MTLHMSGMGYAHIAFVSLPRAENDRARERLRGYLAALGEFGRKPEDGLILERPAGFNAGAEAVVHLIETASDVDAVFFAGDVLAAGATLECQRPHWSVPARIAIASSDDLAMVPHIRPPPAT